MKDITVNQIAHGKNIFNIVIGTVLILMVPLVAMAFTDEVDWNWFDFVVMGGLLLGTGILFELLTTKLPAKYRPLVAVVLLAALALLWAELAVGVFGSPIAGS